jgi:hypothetical protein
MEKNWRGRTGKEENEAYIRPTHVPYKSRDHLQKLGARIRNEMHVVRKLVPLLTQGQLKHINII